MIKEQHEKLKTPAPQKPSLLTQITKTKVEEAKKFCIKNRLKADIFLAPFTLGISLIRYWVKCKVCGGKGYLEDEK